MNDPISEAPYRNVFACGIVVLSRNAFASSEFSVKQARKSLEKIVKFIVLKSMNFL